MELDLDNQTFTTAKAAALMSVSPQAVIKRAKSRNWKAAPAKTQGGGNVWYFSAMDGDAQQRITAAAIRDHKPEPPDPETGRAKEGHLAELWEEFDRKPASVKERAFFRAGLLIDVVKLHEGGATLKAAFTAVAQANSVSAATLRNWYFGIGGKEGVRGHDSKDWAVFLMDRHKGRIVKADCDEIAWEFLKKDYLRREQPSFRSCYRRLERAAIAHGWIIPSERTLKRRINAEFTKAVIDYLRTGKFVNPYPDQVRRRDSMPPGYAVSGDGLCFDSIKVYDTGTGEVYSPYVWPFEDIYSGKILSWAGDKTENSDLFRKSLYNLLGVLLPQYVCVDNTRAASNISLMGQELGRHRFGRKAHHPVGMMKLLGIDVHFTNPDHEVASPGTKPIERAFGIGGLHSEAREHPLLMGRGTEKNPIPDTEFFDVILPEIIAAHNARTGRGGGVCNGRSFDQVFSEGIQHVSLRQASSQLRRLLLCKQESCKVSKQGTVTLKSGQGYGKHRYYGECLVPYEGENVAVFFNPENLSEQVAVYDLNGKLIGYADWLQTVAFNDTKAAREHAKHKNRYKKLVKESAKEAKRMSDLEFRQLNVTPPADEKPIPARTITVLAQPEIRDMVSKPLDTETMNKFRQNMHRNIAAMS